MPQMITNIPRCLPQILTVPKFWYHLAHSFSRKNVPFDFERAFWEAEGALSKPKGPFSRENEAQEMTPKLLALAKVCSVLFVHIRDVSWHLSKRGSELEKRWTFSILDKNDAHKNKAWRRPTGYIFSQNNKLAENVACAGVYKIIVCQAWFLKSQNQKRKNNSQNQQEALVDQNQCPLL